MTVIEFFDKNPIENIASALLCSPRRVVFLGAREERMRQSVERYGRVLSARGIDTELCYRVVDQEDLSGITEALCRIVEEDDCVFDLTGGEELYLVAVGRIMERYGDGVRCHRFNLRSDAFYELDDRGNVCRSAALCLSVKENILLHGGELIEDASRETYTYEWCFDEEFDRDVEAMWQVCRRNPRQWNAHISTLRSLDRRFSEQGSLTVSLSRQDAAALFEGNGGRFTFHHRIMEDLHRAGLLTALTVDRRAISFTYKNPQIRRCMTVAGQALEVLIASRLRRLRDEQGCPVYQDVRVGVVVDWNKLNAPELVRTVNELDVVAMHGVIPVFISCKNGTLDTNELYKLNTVSSMFGREYGRRVLVETQLDRLGQRAEYIKARAADMGIRILRDVDAADDAALDAALRELWRSGAR